MYISGTYYIGRVLQYTPKNYTFFIFILSLREISTPGSNDSLALNRITGIKALPTVYRMHLEMQPLVDPGTEKRKYTVFIQIYIGLHSYLSLPWEYQTLYRLTLKLE